MNAIRVPDCGSAVQARYEEAALPDIAPDEAVLGDAPPRDSIGTRALVFHHQGLAR